MIVLHFHDAVEVNSDHGRISSQEDHVMNDIALDMNLKVFMIRMKLQETGLEMNVNHIAIF
jgi:hypothetical protein